MEAIVRWLQDIDPELTPQEMAELIWLWVEALTPEPLSDPIVDSIVQELSELTSDRESVLVDEPSPVQAVQETDQEIPPPLQAYLTSGNSKAIPFKTPDAPALRHPLELARSLRPFKRKYPSAREMVFDEEATVNRIVDQQLWVPVLKPAAERWFDLTLIVEDTASMGIWRKATEEWLNLLKHHGAFRKVALWYLQYEDEQWQVQSDRSTSTQGTKLGSYRELIESTGRHHFLVLSDCVSPQWTSGAIYPVLKDWSVYNPVTILQVMPEKYWSRTALGRGRTVQLSSLEPDTKNAQLRVQRSSSRRNPLPPNPGLKLPIVTFDRVSLQQWALVMMGTGKTTTVGTVFASQETLTQPRRVASESPETAQSAMDRIQRFRLMASPVARRLAGLMAAVPVTLSIARLIQQAMLKESSQIHLAEVFLSGLIDRESSATHFRNDPEECQYQFFEGVRELLLESISYSDVDDVLDRVSVYIAQKAGYAIKTFNAFLELYPQLNEEQRKILEPFAKLTPTVLRRLGGHYETIADELEAWEPLISPVQEDTLQFAQSETTALPGIPPVASEDPVFPPLEITWGEEPEPIKPQRLKTMAQRTALLIGVTTYGEGIPPLSAAANDVVAMEAVLKNPDMGGFDTVTSLVNPDVPEMQEAIFQLFQQATKEDLVLLFFSGHGITDDNNHLYLSTRRTAKHNYVATAVPARFVQERSHLCYAKRQVMILDCCYSGAFKEGWHLKSVGLDLKRELGLNDQGAEGRAVLTSSSATQVSLQQDGAALSLYTQYLVEGMETGIADTDEDGCIYIQELHDYAKAKVQEVNPRQKPEIILDREGYRILISRSPLQDPKLRFRREVEKYATQTEDYLKQSGDFSAVGKITLLQVKRQEAGLTATEAEAIVASVREPYRRQLENRSLYRQALVAAFEMGDPFPASVQWELQVLRDTLGLGDAEVEEITQQAEVRQAQEKAIEQQRQREAEQTAEIQRQEAERQQNLQHQQELSQGKGDDRG